MKKGVIIRMNKYNISEYENQEDFEILTDVNSSGNINNWKEYKIDSLDLSDTYKRIGYLKRAERVRDCGTDLYFKEYEDGTMKLHSANFCKVRLCPMCSWRRSKKIFGQVSAVMDSLVADAEHHYRFLFLTLTLENVPSDDLSNTIDGILYSFKKLTYRKEFKKSVKGWFRALEVTYNIVRDDFHPHIHCILVVPDYYFNTSEYYLSQKKWTEIWKDCLNVDYTPIVNVKAIKDLSGGNNLKKGVCEVSKYAVKPADILMKFELKVVKGNLCLVPTHTPAKNIKNRSIQQLKRAGDTVFFPELAEKVVETLDNALHNRRLVAFGGIMKDLHKQLNLDDTLDGDLIHTGDDDEIRSDLAYIIVKYRWNIGFMNYQRLFETNISEVEKNNGK